MEDGIGYELFLRRCLNNSEFRIFMRSLDKILNNKKRFCDIGKEWAVFYRGDNRKHKEIDSYIREKLPQPVITNVGEYSDGPFLDILGIGLRKRIQGEKQIKQYVNKMFCYAQKHL